jgi:peptidoglycan/LPS O-acetylase OafA/YrhL
MRAHSGPLAISNVLLYGHLAVDAFIVLSGFCLAIPTANTDELKGGWWLFYRRRAWRILPPYYGCTLLMFAITLLNWLPAGGPLPYTPKGIFVNLFLLGELFPKELGQFNGVVWTVAVEWKIYFLFPFFLWLVRKFGPLMMVLAASVLAASYAVAIHSVANDLSLKHICPWYLILFAFGAWAGRTAFSTKSETKLERLRPALLVLLAVSIALLFAFPVTKNGEDELFSPNLVFIDLGVGSVVALGLLLLKSAKTKSAWITALSWPPIVFVGTFAYSLYLCHGAIYSLLRTILGHLGHRIGADVEGQKTILLVIGLPCAVLASYLFFLAFERPFIRRKVA